VPARPESARLARPRATARCRARLLSRPDGSGTRRRTPVALTAGTPIPGGLPLGRLTFGGLALRGLTLRGLAPSLLARLLRTLPASGPAIGLLTLSRLTVLALTLLALTLLPLLTLPFPAAGRSSARSAGLARRQSARQALTGLG